MPLIECKRGHTNQMVMGQNYSFDRDRYGRFVATVHNDDHAKVFLAVEHYQEVEAIPAPSAQDPVSGAQSPIISVSPPLDPTGNPPSPDAPPGGDTDDNVEHDLLSIKGIGPKLKVKLEGIGMVALSQIASLTPAQIGQLDAELKLHGAIERDNWVGQAKAIVEAAPSAQE